MRGNLIRPAVSAPTFAMVPPVYNDDAEAPKFSVYFNADTAAFSYKGPDGTIYRPGGSPNESTTDVYKTTLFNPAFSPPFDQSNADLYGNITPGLNGYSTEPTVSGTKYYVEEGGDDANGAGTYEDPVATFEPFAEGNRLALSAGDGIVVKGAGASFPDGVGRLLLGTGDIKIMGEQGTFPTVDITAWASNDELVQSYGYDNVVVHGLHILGDSQNTAEAFKFDNTGGTSGTVEEAKQAGYIHNVRVEGIGAPAAMWSGTGTGGVVSHSVAFNCNGGDGNADAWQWTGASGELWTGGYCLNSVGAYCGDDGVDLFRCTGHFTDNCLMIWNGFGPDGTPLDTAPGAGFKLGGSNSVNAGGNVVRNSVAYGHGAAGFTHNGAERPNDYINCVGWQNARKDGSQTSYNRSYEKDFQAFDSGPGSTAENRYINCIAEQGVYDSDDLVDSANVLECNFDHTNTFAIAFDNIPFMSIATDSVGVPNIPNEFARLSNEFGPTDYPDVYESGTASYEPTPANTYHNNDDPPSFSGDAPDLGGYQTQP